MNPFQRFTIPAAGDRFVGRHAERAQIAEMLESGGNLAICGIPKIGKSSLIQQVLLEFPRQERHLILESDFSAIPSWRVLFLDLLEQLKIEVGDQFSSFFSSFQPSELETQYLAWSRLKQFLQLANRNRYKITWVIDEFDAVRSMTDASQGIGQLRNFAVNPSRGGLQVVVISRRPLTLLEDQCGNSTLYLVCSHMELKPMPSEEWRAIVDRASPAWVLDESETRDLEERTGRHPFLTELVLFYSYASRQITKGNGELLEYYEYLRTILTEDSLFQALIELSVGPRWSLTQLQQERLLRYGLVKMVQEGDLVYVRGWSNHFQTWLERQARNTPIWLLLKEVELGLRDLIHTVLAQQIGPDWLEVIRRRHGGVRVAMEGCEQRRAKEKKMLGEAEGRELLDYSYIMDLWVIIQKEWALFQKYFRNRDHRYWELRMQQIVRVRNPEAHNRAHVLLEYELNDGKAACNELKEILGQQLPLLLGNPTETPAA